jgi:hypothetical protein
MSFLHVLSYIEVTLCIAPLTVLTLRKQWADYSSLGRFLLVRMFSDLFLIYFHYAAAHNWLTYHTAYQIYFYVYWPTAAIESIFALLVVYDVFKLAMAPLKGLQALGMLVFKWAGGISVAVALGSAFTPSGPSAGSLIGTDLITNAISQLQRTQSILTLCLLVFVCFAIRPMGLSFKSRIFGVSFGLGVMATNDLVQSAWLAFHPQVMGSTYNKINGVITCLILATWTAYFAFPEPKRRMIVLPTTSPFLRWNQISQALGDDPGFVAVGGVPPELFAPAELEVMRRASAKMPTESTPFPISILNGGEHHLSASRAV